MQIYTFCFWNNTMHLSMVHLHAAKAVVAVIPSWMHIFREQAVAGKLYVLLHGNMSFQ
jgi:hypothetical protein